MEETEDVKIYSGMAYLHDQNIEKFLSKGQHFVMFYAPWCKASQVCFLLIAFDQMISYEKHFILV